MLNLLSPLQSLSRHNIAWLVNLECMSCVRDGKKLILAPAGFHFKAGCVVCQRSLGVTAERLFVYAGFLVIRIVEY